MHYDRYRNALVAWWVRLGLLGLLALLLGWLVYRAGNPAPMGDLDRLLALAFPFLAVTVLGLHLAQVDKDQPE
jgi:hypothetical protein